uniref:Uncharacterized protein n=1 Tax=Desulfatirhabdium butyrativorans TaxID=340467 RepID=A0A7C4ML06_9BACT
MKKTIKFGLMAIALFAILGVMADGAWADTSTVSGAYIFDKTSVSAGDYVNVSILGLDKNGAVDVYGEQFGATIFATVSSVFGTITAGGSSASSPSPGVYSTDVKYVSLNQGKGKASIYYDPTVSGNDSVNITLQEKYQAEGGGFVYRTISTYTQTIAVAGKAAKAGWLLVTDIVGTAKSFTGDTIGTMTAGASGKQFQVVAYTAVGNTTTDTAASGPVTLTIRPAHDMDKYGNQAKTTYNLTGTMTGGIAYITTDGSIKEAGRYYVEAMFDGKSSVQPLFEDVLDVMPKSTAHHFELTASSKFFPTASGFTPNLWPGASITISSYLNDEYGNRMTLPSGKVDVKIKDKNGIIADQSGSFTPADAKLDFLIDRTDILSNGLDKDGTAILVASDPTKSILDSNNLELEGKKSGLWVDWNVLGTNLTAGNNNAFFQNFSYGTGTTNTFTSGSTVTVQYISKKGTDTCPTSVNPDNTVTVKFNKALTGGYFLFSKDGYAPYWVPGKDIAPGDADSAKIVNAHGSSLTALSVVGNRTTVWSNRVIVTDKNGNSVKNNYNYKVSSSKSGVSFDPTAATGTANDTVKGNNVTVTYDPTKFTGTDDTFTISILGAPGVDPLKPIVTIPGTTSLKTILMSISTTTLPLNGEAPLCVETLDANGNRVNSDIFMTLTGSVTPTVKDNAGNSYINGSKLISTGRTILVLTVPSKTGDFTITFKNAAGTIVAEKQFTVTGSAQQSKTVGDKPGEQKVDVAPSENLNIVVNTTNKYGDTPKYQWFVFTATAGGAQLPLYLLSDKGIVPILPGLDIYQYTYSYPTGSTVQIAQLKMSDLGLKAGDTFAYAYAYETAAGKFVMDNVVIITVK